MIYYMLINTEQFAVHCPDEEQLNALTAKLREDGFEAEVLTDLRPDLPVLVFGEDAGIARLRDEVVRYIALDTETCELARPTSTAVVAKLQSYLGAGHTIEAVDRPAGPVDALRVLDIQRTMPQWPGTAVTMIDRAPPITYGRQSEKYKIPVPAVHVRSDALYANGPRRPEPARDAAPPPAAHTHAGPVSEEAVRAIEKRARRAAKRAAQHRGDTRP